MAIEIVDLSIKNGGSFHNYVNVYQRVIHYFWDKGFEHEGCSGPMSGIMTNRSCLKCTEHPWFSSLAFSLMEKSMDWFKGKFTGKPHI